jgi:hypothetical protein
MAGRMCRKGKSCGATCISGRYRCVLELGPLVASSVGKVRDKLGVMGLWRQAKQHKAPGYNKKFNELKKQVEKERAQGRPLRKQADLKDFEKRLKEAGLVPKSAKTNIADMFMRQIAAGDKEKKEAKLPSVPSDLKRQLAALQVGKPDNTMQKVRDKANQGLMEAAKQPVVLQGRQLDRSPGARTRTAPAVRKELDGIKESIKKGSMDLVFDDISRMLRGSLPQNIQMASAPGEAGFKARLRGSASNTKPGATTGNTKWDRTDAKDFDGKFKIYKRIRGDQDTEDWNESSSKGKKLGEGGFGTVLTAGANKVHKRGEIGENEPDILKIVGKADLGPKLLVAELAAKKGQEYGVNIHDGRIAMTRIKGEPIGMLTAETKVNGKNMADIYWKAMADLHRLGVAHNDAHTDNILVDKQGKGRWVDMGLAQANPKAALAEAMGVFNTLRGYQAERVAGAQGQGNWQARRWPGTGIDKAELAKKNGAASWKEFQERFPVASKVWNNREPAQDKLLKFGLTKNDISSIIDHGIRSTPESYTKGAMGKLTDKQAQEVLNILYDGI